MGREGKTERMGGSRSEIFSMLMLRELSGSAPLWPVSPPGSRRPSWGRRPWPSLGQEECRSLLSGQASRGGSALGHPDQLPGHLLFHSDSSICELPGNVLRSWLLLGTPCLVSTLLPPAHSPVSKTQPVAPFHLAALCHMREASERTLAFLPPPKLILPGTI